MARRLLRPHHCRALTGRPGMEWRGGPWPQTGAPPGRASLSPVPSCRPRCGCAGRLSQPLAPIFPMGRNGNSGPATARFKFCGPRFPAAHFPRLPCFLLDRPMKNP